MPKWQPNKPWQVTSTAVSKDKKQKFYLSWDASRPSFHDIKEVTLQELRGREDGAAPFVGQLFKIVTPLPATHYFRLKRKENGLVLD